MPRRLPFPPKVARAVAGGHSLPGGISAGVRHRAKSLAGMQARKQPKPTNRWRGLPRPEPVRGKKPLPPKGLRLLFYCVAGHTSSTVAQDLYHHWERHPPGFPVIVDFAGYITGRSRTLTKQSNFMELVRRADVVIPILGHDDFGIKDSRQTDESSVHTKKGTKEIRPTRVAWQHGKKGTKEIKRKRMKWYAGLSPLSMMVNLALHSPAEAAQQIEAWVAERYVLSGRTFVPALATGAELRPWVDHTTRAE